MRLDGGFQEFYEANYGRIVAMVTAVLGDRHEAEDVAQEAFARAFTRWSRLGGYDLPEAWVRQVALRIAIDSGRRLRRSLRVVATLAAQRHSPGPEPCDSLALTRLGTALLRLPMREREVVVLHYLADLPVDAIAKERGLPPGTVRTRLAAGRRRLEHELWYQGISSIALTADGAKLAIATNRESGDQNGPADIEVISLATGTTRTWTSTPQDISSLSWAGNSTLAYACDGVCLLDTTAPGHELSQSRLLIPWSTQYHGLQGLQWPMITPDGSAIYVAMENGPGSLGLVEFSARTGRPLRVVIQPQNTDGAFCGTLWSDPSGQHLTAACTWEAHTGTVDNGHFTPGRNLPPQTPGTDTSGAGGELIAW